MHFLFVLFLGLFLVILPSVNSINAEEVGIEDLVSLEDLAVNDSTEGNQQLAQRPQKEGNIDDLLGPKDNFPFLPDNHRDSGTGKFNSF